MACAVVALVLIVVLINFFLSPSGPKNPMASQAAVTGEEVGGTTNAVPHPRSHLIY